jgi:hypoxanthine phosphoribosyltransferase
LKNVDVIISGDQVAKRIKELGSELTEYYNGKNPVVIPLLKGGFMFAADLIREMKIDLQLEFLGAASYGDQTITSGEVRLTLDTTMPLAGRHVLLVEDIVDTGLTLAYIYRLLHSRNPESLRTVVLLDKVDRREVEVEVDWVGFAIPDRFVFGYGLDSDGGLNRNLRHIVARKELQDGNTR